jgi:hypothetical protein
MIEGGHRFQHHRVLDLGVEIRSSPASKIRRFQELGHAVVLHRELVQQLFVEALPDAEGEQLQVRRYVLPQLLGRCSVWSHVDVGALVLAVGEEHHAIERGPWL